LTEAVEVDASAVFDSKTRLKKAITNFGILSEVEEGEVS
jgi:hypothetical protein